MVRSSFFEIRDPIHGPISLSQQELTIIDSPYVQRLRGIKQTGFAELAFPGATHNRYSHSLGAFHLAGRAFDQIFQDHAFFSSKEERAKYRHLLRMAALLHDAGHGPLSHAIEQAMPPKAELFPELKGNTEQASHEDYTQLILLRSSLTQLLASNFDTDFPSAVAQLIRNENQLPNYFKTTTGLNVFPILSSLISSELDVDRMDYLVRDSLYCGIPYGNFDRDWIFSNLTSYQQGQDVYLALDSRATYAFEDFLLSRYHMFVQVYLHHKSVIYDEMLYQFLLTDEKGTKLPSSIEDYLPIDDNWLWSQLRLSSNEWAKRIITQKPYKMILEIQADMAEQAKSYADEVEQKLKRQGIAYFRSSSTGLLSKYSNMASSKSHNPIYVIYRDPRYTSSLHPGKNVEPISEAVELFDRYKKKRIIDRIYAERKIEA
jgi:HD superfamily phosphohydrolase